MTQQGQWFWPGPDNTTGKTPDSTDRDVTALTKFFDPILRILRGPDPLTVNNEI